MVLCQSVTPQSGGWRQISSGSRGHVLAREAGVKTLDSVVVRKRRICSNACGVLQIVKLYLNPQTFLPRVGGWGSENPIGGG